MLSLPIVSYYQIIIMIIIMVALRPHIIDQYIIVSKDDDICIVDTKGILEDRSP